MAKQCFKFVNVLNLSLRLVSKNIITKCDNILKSNQNHLYMCTCLLRLLSIIIYWISKTIERCRTTEGNILWTFNNKYISSDLKNPSYYRQRSCCWWFSEVSSWNILCWKDCRFMHPKILSRSKKQRTMATESNNVKMFF